MAYDPQANRRRPRPDADAPAPVDALLGDPVPPSSGGDGPGPVADDPPPSPAVTPAPASIAVAEWRTQGCTEGMYSSRSSRSSGNDSAADRARLEPDGSRRISSPGLSCGFGLMGSSGDMLI